MGMRPSQERFLDAVAVTMAAVVDEVATLSRDDARIAAARENPAQATRDFFAMLPPSAQDGLTHESPYKAALKLLAVESRPATLEGVERLAGAQAAFDALPEAVRVGRGAMRSVATAAVNQSKATTPASLDPERFARDKLDMAIAAAPPFVRIDLPATALPTDLWMKRITKLDIDFGVSRTTALKFLRGERVRRQTAKLILESLLRNAWDAYRASGLPDALRPA